MTDGHSPINVLIVEDDPEVAQLFEEYLADGFTTRTALGGVAALELIDDSIDVVLLDRRMPDLDGDEVLRHFRSDGFDQPVVMLTAVRPDDDIMELSIDDYLTKPIDRDSVVETVRFLANRGTFEAKSREFFRLLSKRGALSRDATQDRGSGLTTARVSRLSELRNELDETMGNLLTDELSRTLTREPIEADIQSLLAEIVDHPLPVEVETLLEDYRNLPDARPTFMWQWVHRLAPQNTLPIVDERYRSKVPVDKTIAILFITLLDDRLEKRGDRATFSELAKSPSSAQTPDPSRAGVDAEYVQFVERVWRTLMERLQRAPRFELYEDLFRFDINMAIAAIEYSDITIRNPALATMGDLERIESNNMVMFAYADIDLMHASADHRDDLSVIRDVVQIAQHMARIGNWVSTWERELREGDWSSGPVVYALEHDVLSRSEIRRSSEDKRVQDALIERVHQHGIEQKFLAEWERRYHELRDYNQSRTALNLEPFIEGTEEVLRYHLASKGRK